MRGIPWARLLFGVQCFLRPDTTLRILRLDGGGCNGVTSNSVVHTSKLPYISWVPYISTPDSSGWLTANGYALD
jgi:hypothetical protein